MKFPTTNKIHKEVEEKFGENAKALEELLSKINWKLFLRVYFVFLGIFLITAFLIIVIIRSAFIIF